MRSPLKLLIGFLLAMQLFACAEPESTATATAMRVGVLPDESVEALRERYIPLFEYLSRETGLAHELIIPDSYDDLLTRFGAGQIDLAYFGGVTFVNARSDYGAIPLVMRDVDSRFTTVFLVRSGSGVNLRDSRGKSLAFGSELSTSGHLMPRFFLHSEYRITPEEHFASVRYSGKHDRTAYWVRDGVVDVGAANAEVVRKMIDDGRLQADDVRIIWTTPPYADYVWAARPGVPESYRRAVQRAFLQLSVDDPRQKALLSALGTNGFYPASEKDFAVLSELLARLAAR